MIAGRDIPFTCSDKNSGTVCDRSGKVPALIIDRVRRGNKGDTIWRAADRTIKIGGLGRWRDAAVGALHNANKTSKPRRMSQLFRDLMKPGFLEGNSDPTPFL